MVTKSDLNGYYQVKRFYVEEGDVTVTTNGDIKMQPSQKEPMTIDRSKGELKSFQEKFNCRTTMLEMGVDLVSKFIPK